MKPKPLFIIHYTLFISLIVSCTKTPTDTDKTKQVTVTNDITENTTWTSGIDYIIEGAMTVEQGVFLDITGLRD